MRKEYILLTSLSFPLCASVALCEILLIGRFLSWLEQLSRHRADQGRESLPGIGHYEEDDAIPASHAVIARLEIGKGEPAKGLGVVEGIAGARAVIEHDEAALGRGEELGSPAVVAGEEGLVVIAAVALVEIRDRALVLPENDDQRVSLGSAALDDGALNEGAGRKMIVEEEGKCAYGLAQPLSFRNFRRVARCMG
jgi:hypothetical protein